MAEDEAEAEARRSGRLSGKRILLLGGYGGFGARIAVRLAAAGHEVLVAGRSLAKASAFCAGRAGLRPLAVTVPDGVAAAIARERPWAVIDAAGPFQSAGYDVPRAAITSGCHYFDIADARDFVCGIGALDPAARGAGLAILSGASSLPALSGAAVRALAKGMDDVRAIEISLSTTSAGTVGASVTRAILSYAGKAVRVQRGGRWTRTYGWQELRRERFDAAGLPPIRGREVAIADVPDLELLPARLPGAPAVTFRAGTEPLLHNFGLWLLSWAVRRGWIGSLSRYAPLLIRAQALTAGRGSGRSAMAVRLFGIAGGRRLERRWTIIAEQDAGPEIPALTVPILVDRLARGRLAPGARDAGEELALAEYEAAFADLAIRHEQVEVEQPPPLYARIMGSNFSLLSPAVQEMHDVLRDGGACGRADVRRGRNPISRLIGAIIDLPQAGEHDLHVHFEERQGVERWTRSFDRSRFHSHFSKVGDLLVERFGPFRFGFALTVEGGALAMHLRCWWLGPVPLPLALAPRSPAREWQEGGRFHFDAPIELPLVGLLVHYRGWLEPVR